MLKMKGRSLFGGLALVALVTILTTSCSSSAAPGGRPSSKDRRAASHQSNLPNPFKVVDRFNPSSLGLDHPAALAVGPDGNLYVTDANQEVSVISPGGKIVRRWGKPGSGAGQFRFSGHGANPYGWYESIAIGHDGRVYVSDSGNYRVEVFSPTGTFLNQFGHQGSSGGQFLLSHSLAVDSTGNVYVSDDQVASVSKFSATGQFAWRIGGPAPADPDLVGHEHLATVDTHSKVVMANDDMGTILYIDGNGHKVDAFAVHKPSCDVTVDARGDTFVNERCGGPGGTEVFDRTHQLIGSCYRACPLWTAPRFGPHGEAFALGKNGTILKLQVALP